LQQCNGFRLANGAPWYVCKRQILEDPGVPMFSDHIRALVASVDCMLADVGKPLVRQIGRHIRSLKLVATVAGRAVYAIARNCQVD
jgi:hypothetical protein